jgi:5'(3')-deoxyribonucleotidase
MTPTRIKRVGIDLDGTVADYMAGAIPMLKEHYGLEPTLNTKAYHIEEVFGLTAETRPKGMHELLYEEKHLFRHLPAIEGMSDVVYCLHIMGVKVYFITARAGTPTIVKDTREWLSENRFVYDDVFHTEEKGLLCKMMHIHVMIEDEVAQILSTLSSGVNVVVPDQPWNQHLSAEEMMRRKGKAVRVYNADDIFNAVKGFLP